MIIVRSPLRVTLGGGGTDLLDYYREHGGFCISAAIDKYVYATVTRPFLPGIFLKYSKLEQVKKVDEVEHSRIREALKLFNIKRIELTTLADIPAGTGLGSSSSFTTALLKALHVYNKMNTDTRNLAEQACHLEINVLKEPIGKQDQYISAYGGVQGLTFTKDDHVEVNPIKVSDELEENLLLFYTGIQRETSAFVTKNNDGLKYTHEQGLTTKQLLEENRLHTFGMLLTDQYSLRREYNPKSTNPTIDALIKVGITNGAVGGKLVGAGGGGFLMFYAEDKVRLRKAMQEAGLEEVRFRFEYEGTKVLLAS